MATQGLNGLISKYGSKDIDKDKTASWRTNSHFAVNGDGFELVSGVINLTSGWFSQAHTVCVFYSLFLI